MGRVGRAYFLPLPRQYLSITEDSPREAVVIAVTRIITATPTRPPSFDERKGHFGALPAVTYRSAGRQLSGELWMPALRVQRGRRSISPTRHIREDRGPAHTSFACCAMSISNAILAHTSVRSLLPVVIRRRNSVCRLICGLASENRRNSLVSKAFGGEGWIRTSVGIANGFTARPL